jgi:beta-glucosidase
METPGRSFSNNGTGQGNQKGIDFYHRVIDHCLDNNIQPWLTLYH